MNEINIETAAMSLREIQKELRAARDKYETELEERGEHAPRTRLALNTWWKIYRDWKKVHDSISKLDVKEFRELGLLKEINRKFLRPRGLVLEVVYRTDGTEHFGTIWDFRDETKTQA
jgi:hypothetical protein